MNCLETAMMIFKRKSLQQELADSIQIFSAGEADELIKEYYGNMEEMKQIAIEFLNQKKITGSPDEFHNLSISFSRNDDYYNACKILRKGLDLYPYEVNLLADFLCSCINCGLVDEGKKYFHRLSEIPKIRWTWRAFSFSIDFLLFFVNEINEEHILRKERDRIWELSEEYLKFFENLEDVYICKYEIHHSFNENNKAEACLEKAINKLKVCDRCALRYADIMFDRGDYVKANEAIQKCLSSSARTQQTINLSYAYMLSGLCKISIHYNELASNKEIVKGIYKDFQIAREYSSALNYEIIMERQIRILEIKSGVYYSEVIDV